MKILGRLVLFLIILAVVLAAASFLLPRSHKVSRSIDIRAPAPVVFMRVSDLRQWSTWTPWNDRDPQMTMEYSPNTVGVGAWQKWKGPKVGQGEVKITAVEAPTRLTYDLHLADFDSHSKGEIQVAAAGGFIVRVTWSDAANTGLNPVKRWMGLFRERMMGPDFQAGLERLKASCEQQLR